METFFDDADYENYIDLKQSGTDHNFQNFPDEWPVTSALQPVTDRFVARGFARCGVGESPSRATARKRRPAFRSGRSFHRGGEESVRAMQIRAKLEVFSRIEIDVLGLHDFGGIQQPETGMALEELLDDLLVFFGQNAASRVDEPPPGFQKNGCARKNGKLLFLQLHDASFGLPPFQVRIPPQRA